MHKARASQSFGCRYAVRLLAAVSVVVAGSLVTGCAKDAAPATRPAAAVAAPTLTAEQKQANLESFDLVWTLVRDRHYDPSLNGVDWNAVRAELRPKMESAETAAQARAVLTDMISRLGQSHMAVLPAAAYVNDDIALARESPAPSSGAAPSAGTGSGAGASASTSARPAAPGTVGIDIRVQGGRAYVSRVAPDSPAAAAGVHAGWELVSVGRLNVRDALARQSSEEPEVGMPRTAMQSMLLRSIANPGLNETIHLGFLDGSDKAVVKTLVGVTPTGFPVKFGQLPTEYLELRSEVLPGDIAYLHTNIWLDPIRTMKFVESVIKVQPTPRALIIDLRGNPGGLGVMAMGMGGYFVSRPEQVLGEMKMRQGNQRFVLNPRSPRFDGPVAILIDDLSASTSEIFAGGMRDIGRARVFGTRSAGAALPSVIEILPNGDRFQYVFANYTSANGSALEGLGVLPDQVVAFDRKALLAGKDPVIEAASQWILSQSPSVSSLK